MVGSEQGLPCGSIGTVTTGQEPVVDVFPASPHSIQIPHSCRQGMSIYEVILSDHPEQKTVLTRCGLARSHVDLPGTKFQWRFYRDRLNIPTRPDHRVRFDPG